MTDKEKIKEQANIDISNLLAQEQGIITEFGKGQLEALEGIVDFIDSLKEEPVSEDLEEELHSYIKSNFTIDKEQLERFGIEEKDYTYSMDESDMLKMIRHFTNNYKVPASNDLEEAAKLCVSDSLCITNEEDWDDAAVDALNIFKAGAKWQQANLWKPADGDDLPEIDREVIALLNNGKVVYAHRPNPNGWDGKSITTGKVEHYDVQTYDKGGWNIPDVKFWLDCNLPNLEQL